MMQLPKLSKSAPTANELKDENERLKIQANKMLDETDVMSVFAKHADVGQIGGSYKYGLMVYPDLDFGVVTNSLNREVFANLLADLAKQAYIKKIKSVDKVAFRSSKHTDTAPKGYWIGLEIPFEGDSWGLDSWLQQKNVVGVYEDPYYERLKALSEAKRGLILQIKYDLIQKELYGSKFQSIQPYEAVLKNDISTVDEFYDLFDKR